MSTKTTQAATQAATHSTQTGGRAGPELGIMTRSMVRAGWLAGRSAQAVDVAPTFAHLLKRHRLAAGLMQDDLAERAGLSTRGISDLERGVRRLPRRQTVQALVAALGLSAHEGAELRAAARRLSPGSAGPGAVPLAASARAHLRSDQRAEPPLVGRAHEIALLERFLAGEGPPVLLLAGEPGIGKSRLLREAMQRARPGGWAVVEGGCQRLGGQDPYAPLDGALTGYVRRRSPARLRSDLHGCAWLVRLLPELADLVGESLPSWSVPLEQERRLMFAAVARFLANVAGPTGTLLLLDDLHWAGSDALDLLATLVRAPDGPLRIVGAYRDTEAQPGDPLAVLLADLADAGLAVQRTLPPLTQEEGQRLVEGLLADDLGTLHDRVVQRAGGVPFFLLSLAQSLRDSPRDDGGAAGAEVVPWIVAQGIRRRVAALSQAAQDVVAVAAVVGSMVHLGLVSAVTGGAEAEVVDALDVAARARLLVTGAQGYRFAHDVIREVVESDLGAARRRLLHRQVAHALEEEPGAPPIELVAYHYAQTEEHSAAAIWLERAGDQAVQRYAHGVALAHYTTARQRRTLSGADPVTLAGLDEKLGGALRTAGQHDRALAPLEQAAEAYQAAGDEEGLRRVMVSVGWAHSFRGTSHEGIQRLQPFVDTWDASAPSPSRVDIAIALGFLFSTAGCYSEALAATERAVQAARALGDDLVVARATVFYGDMLATVGRVGEALGAATEAIPSLQAQGDPLFLVFALNLAAWSYATRGEFAASTASLERGLVVVERMGDAAYAAFLRAAGAGVDIMRGDWSRARTALERAVALCRAVGTTWFSPYPLVRLGHLCLAEGAWDTAAAYAREAGTMAERTGDLQARRWAAALLAELDLAEGRPAAARARLVPLLDRPGLAETDVTFFLPVLAWAYLELGEVDEAAAVVTQALARLRPENVRTVLVEALRVQAMVAMRQGRSDQAERAIEEGLSLAQRLPYPYAAARLLHVDGLLHAQNGAPARALARLDEAVTIFRRLGAQGRRAGGAGHARPRRRPASGHITATGLQ